MTVKRLPVASQAKTGLGMPTIMDPALAAKYGAPYVQLAAFAIDVDRIYALDEENPTLPFGWEVFLTECFLIGRIKPKAGKAQPLLEDACLSILEQEPDQQGYGSQLLFAVYDATEHGHYPQSLKGLFRSWSGRPRLLQKALTEMWKSPAATMARCAAHCLAETLQPPLSPPSHAAFSKMVAGSWRLPVD